MLMAISPTEKWIPPAAKLIFEEEVGMLLMNGSEAPVSTEQTSDGRFLRH